MKKPTTLAMMICAGTLWMATGLAAAATRENVPLTTRGGLRFTLAVVTPEIEDSELPPPMVLALPPGNGDMNMVNAFLANYWLEEADRRGYVLISPTVMGRSLETSSRDVLGAIFEWVDANVEYDEQRVVLAGQSNGGLGAFHVARVAPGRFSSVIVMPGGFGGPGSLDMLAEKPVLLAVGERDTNWVQLTHTTRDFLRVSNAQPRVDIVPGAGHVFPYPPEDLFDWMEQWFPE